MRLYRLGFTVIRRSYYKKSLVRVCVFAATGRAKGVIKRYAGCGSVLGLLVLPMMKCIAQRRVRELVVYNKTYL